MASLTRPNQAESVLLEQHVWPNGNYEFTASEQQLDAKGLPNFGWAFWQNSRYAGKGGLVTTKHYCRGAMKCAAAGCNFVLRPMAPVKSQLGETSIV